MRGFLKDDLYTWSRYIFMYLKNACYSPVLLQDHTMCRSGSSTARQWVQAEEAPEDQIAAPRVVE